MIGELVQRSCGELNLTICQQANLVEYCYCEGNLCNSKEKELPSTTTDQTSDDEDDERGTKTLLMRTTSQNSLI